MDFTHECCLHVLLVGTCAGDVVLWNVRSGEKLLSRNFKVWDIEACSMTFKVHTHSQCDTVIAKFWFVYRI